MLSRLQKARGDEGFTLIELLVVIIIIGILAAIAIPVFLRQRENAWNAAVQADLRNAATAEETVLTETGLYTNDVAVLQSAGFKYSGDENYTGNSALITATNTGGEEYCLEATSAAEGGSKVWSYSSPGGLVEGGC